MIGDFGHHFFFYICFMKNHKEILRQKVLKHGWKFVSEMIGGFDILYKHVFSNDYNEFLNLFNNLEVVQSDENPNYTLYRFEKGKNLMVYDRKNEYVYFNFDVIWSFNSIACILSKSAYIGITRNDTAGEYDPQPNPSNIVCVPLPVSVCGSKYLTMAGSSL